MELAHAVRARLGRELGALRALVCRDEHELLALLRIRQAHHGVLRLWPRARRELLDGIAARAKNKSVAKRAKALVQDIDDAEAARKAAREVCRR